MKFEDNLFKIAIINKRNFRILINLAQAYEAEFSAITKKIPDKYGVFKLDTLPILPYIGYLLYINKIPVGFCIIKAISKIKDISEFYIIPSMRKRKLGIQFAHCIFDKYPGQWQVRQISGAYHAIDFWRKTIALYTNNKFKESVKSDKDWGIVTCQRFISKRKVT